MSAAARAVVLDVDGTLVDTNYLHVIAWQRAFAGIDLDAPAWSLHRQVGKGGDKFVAAAAGEEVERQHGDALRDLHGDHFGELIDEARPLPGARDLLVALRERGVASVLASSGNADEVEHYLDLLDARKLLAGWTSSGDVSNSKPAPDLVEVALARVAARPAVMVGDSVWDAVAAERAGIGFIGLRSGGISETELRAAGARRVYDTAADLARDLDGAGIGSG
ncbi:HAD family hydrolase [Conexibacter sp. CPCC 206217]|uniref:HAD family hydrolase n=1 Tax=Conexibacter sp. CPCC 206217 TaxID=3064574 RepID=UPI0027258446|nr:HAD family hydrolase [Conexibacter sp. CPCC 206217]MDO8210471.1 HAD family hydrolase [Conexibacter sp. CPCC 206217]